MGVDGRTETPNAPSGRAQLARRAGVVSAAVALSRVLGVVREQAFAIFFGAGRELDAFITAFRIPNLMRDLYARYVPVARAYFVRHGVRDDEDLAHEAVLVALRALRDARVRERERIGGFLLGVCKNLVRDRARRDARADRALVREQASAATSAASTAASANDARIDGFKLWGCVNALSARARDVVLRTWVHDDDADTIAQAQATTAGNVRVMRHRALAALLECLERRERGGAQ